MTTRFEGPKKGNQLQFPQNMFPNDPLNVYDSLFRLMAQLIALYQKLNCTFGIRAARALQQVSRQLALT